MNTYVKAVLYAYPFLKTVEEDYEEHIKNRALLSYRSNKTAEELACAIAEDILEKDKLVRLKGQIEWVLDRLSDVEKTLVGVRYFGKRRKINRPIEARGERTSRYFDWSERKYFRVQSRLVGKLRSLFVAVGLTRERFEQELAHTELFEKICRYVEGRNTKISREERAWLKIV